jgi:hypothetical protein
MTGEGNVLGIQSGHSDSADAFPWSLSASCAFNLQSTKRSCRMLPGNIGAPAVKNVIDTIGQPDKFGKLFPECQKWQ